jgi:hypothetical protein
MMPKYHEIEEKIKKVVNNMIRKIIRMKDLIMNFIKLFLGWYKLFFIVLENIADIIKNPSFVMFSLIALALGTMGIWVPLYPFFNVDNLIGKIESTTVFTFCIATLGNMATEYIFDKKDDDDKTDYKEILSTHAAFFLWAIALFLSFLCLANDAFIWHGLTSTLILWLFVNIRREKFQRYNPAVLNNFNPNLNQNSDVDEFKGDGL